MRYNNYIEIDEVISEDIHIFRLYNLFVGFNNR